MTLLLTKGELINQFRACGASYLEEGNAKGEHRKAFRIAIKIKEE